MILLNRVFIPQENFENVNYKNDIQKNLKLKILVYAELIRMSRFRKAVFFCSLEGVSKTVLYSILRLIRTLSGVWARSSTFIAKLPVSSRIPK